MGEDVGMSLVPAENRGYRELYAFSRGLAEHWTRLADQLGEPAAGTTRPPADAEGLVTSGSGRSETGAGYLTSVKRTAWA